MKTFLKISIFVFFVSILTISCKKEEAQTDLDKIEAGLTSFVESNQLTKCTIMEYTSNSYFYVVGASTFKISNGFISVYVGSLNQATEYRYNLHYLYNYSKDGDLLSLVFIMN
jgi:hypothetical protein